MQAIPRYWAGTPESLHAYMEAVAKVMDSDLPTKKADYLSLEDDPEDVPRLVDMQGNVAVISIKGPLTNSDSWMNFFTGAVSYSSIREALIWAVNNDAVKAIALDIQSGGGSVSGLADTADLIKTIDTKVKPVYAYGDSLIASAAYRLGMNARTLHIGRETEAGSIGVVMVVKEMTKMLANEGITATVIRSGKWKMLGNPYEELSDSAKETFQAQVDQLNEMFVADVAACRKRSSTQVESDMGQGRIFIGQSAVDVGLVDGVTNFDAFMSEVSLGIAISQKPLQYSTHLTKGASVATALTDQKIAEVTLTPVAAAAAQVAATTQPEVPATVEIAQGQAAPAAPAQDAGVVALLQSQLATAQAQVLQLSIDLKGAETAKAASDASAEKLRPVARAGVAQLRIALGGAAAGIEALTDDTLMAEHANLSAQFAAKFPTGGVAAVSSSASSGSASTDVADPLRQARLAATRNSK